MLKQPIEWTKAEIRKQLDVVSGDLPPTVLIKNARWLNSATKRWRNGHIWIHGDRIVYAGEKLTGSLAGTDVYDAAGKSVVPGYIEHHAHPFQLYHPLSFARYASERGTTTLINDNMSLFLQYGKKKAFSFLEAMQKTPVLMLWWARYDPQTALASHNEKFTYENIMDWLDHPYVVQGGELTDWPSVLNGDDAMLHWMQETKARGMRIEGHMPGAGEGTLTRLALTGVDCDHEAMTGEELLRRLDLGYTVSMRYSSIRPDLPGLLDTVVKEGLCGCDRLLMTTDGSPPKVMEEGVMDRLIEIALGKGVPFIDAVNMATYNVAKHYRLDHVLGMIAPGRLANINILESEENPRPVSVMAKGEWVVRDGEAAAQMPDPDWPELGLPRLELDWELTEADLQFSMPLGVEMINDVIMKPYQTENVMLGDEIPQDSDESFFVLIDRHGKWRVNTIIKGFARNLHGMASSFSNTGDLILIGKSKQGITEAFRALKKQGGGIVVTGDDGVEASIPLTLNGKMSTLELPQIAEQERHLLRVLQQKGYIYGDPVYALLFFSATHLPYVRVTQRGIIDVKQKKVLFPAIMR
ncbi:adenine deaminase C-terminal domain-containing protein [Alteribacter natronophilus]|uniref:adenine deaminase C-terminal domain-containing protein n=1 Tax=Alteribacter natronophilus TaxID=2583810 RepID=UPI00110ED83A|nr:adenine deaminase C-terminal domain-containing protein [Alteribacter natronophilus]TMW71109.1 adenine deaminase [Alteribacter natronophilus]